MRFETLLNHVEKYKLFVYESAELRQQENDTIIEVKVRPRKNGKPICSGCRRSGSLYDHGKEPRRFDYIPLWNIAVVFVYTMRRVNCRVCGVRIEEVPWAVGKSPQTRSLKIFLATWARRLSWQEVASIFGTTWPRVCDAVRWVVLFGLEHRDLSGITAIGVDEIQYRHGHKYLTLVYQIDAGARRLLYVGAERTAKTLLRFFHDFGRERCAALKFVCSDMWRPYLKVIKKKAKNALHILDRFHIVANLNKAINEVRAKEARRMRSEGYEEVLKHTKYCFLKNEENLTPKQTVKLKDVLQYDLKSVRAYLLKEAFQLLWNYKSPYWAEWYLKQWCARAMRSRLEPIKKFVKSMRGHQDLLMNWFKAKKVFSSGVVEGLNRKVNLVTRKSYGFRTYSTLETALFHNLGNLPEPPVTHRFC